MRRSLKTSLGKNRRGVTMVGLMALAVLLAVCCSIILDRSVEAYRAGAMLEWRLQARAAAEGVAVMVANDPAHPPEPQVLGPATVICRPPQPAGNAQAVVPMEVSIRPHGSTVARYTARYLARCIRSGAGWQLLRLEE